MRSQAAPLALACAVLASGCFLERGAIGGPLDAGQASDARSSDAGARCGDGVRQGAEDCDGDDLGGATCAGHGLPDGPLACSTTCTLETSACTGGCGNGRIDAPEECDGTELGGRTCAALGLSGALRCTPGCRVDPSACEGCGNGRIEPGEHCDGAALGRSCTGGLACDAACRYDASACTWPSAGDGRDGDLTIDSDIDIDEAASAPDYVVSAIETSGVTLTSDASALAPGDLVLLVNVQGGGGDCASAGAHELAEVASVAGARVELASSVRAVYGIGGNADLSGQRVLLQRVPQLGALTITSRGRLGVSGWNGTRGGVLAFVARALVVEAGGAIDAGREGFRGGPGQSSGSRNGRRGEGICDGSRGEGTMPAEGAGGGGRFVDPGDGCGQGGGGAGYASAGTSRGYPSECVRVGATGPADNAGGVYGSATLDRIFLGSGAGGGATDEHSSESGGGGAGGGIVLVHAASARIDGEIRAPGGDGSLAEDTNDAGNGGGGSGGSIVLRIGRLGGAGRITAAGGRGRESATSWNGAGGDGAEGRIRVDFASASGAAFGSPEAEAFVTAMGTPEVGHLALYLE